MNVPESFCWRAFQMFIKVLNRTLVIFNMIFSYEEKPLTARLKAVNDYGPNYASQLQSTLQKIQVALPDYPVEKVPLTEYMVLFS